MITSLHLDGFKDGPVVARILFVIVVGQTAKTGTRHGKPTAADIQFELSIIFIEVEELEVFGKVIGLESHGIGNGGGSLVQHLGNQGIIGYADVIVVMNESLHLI